MKKKSLDRFFQRWFFPKPPGQAGSRAAGALCALSCLALALADHAAGPLFLSPLYLLPIFFASWNNGLVLGTALAFVSSAGSTSVMLKDPSWTWYGLVLSFVLHAAMFTLFARFVFFSRKRTALVSEIKLLTGILPICAYCKRIRNARDEWESIEVYIRNRSDAEFSHGICPECTKKIFTLP